MQKLKRVIVKLSILALTLQAISPFLVIQPALADLPAVVATVGVGSNPRGVAITPDGAYAYVTNTADSTISVIKTANNTVVDTITGLANPIAIAFTPSGAYAYVTNVGDNTVLIIDSSSNTNNTVVGSPIPVGSGAVGIDITPDGAFIYVTNANDNTVSVISTTTNLVVGSPIAVGNGPLAVAITPDGAFAYVTNGYDNTVSVIDTSTNLVVGSPIVLGSGGLPQDIAITPDGAFAYVAAYNNVVVISTATNLVVGSPINDGVGAYYIAITPDGAFAYVASSGNTVYVIHTTNNGVVGLPIPVGTDPARIAITPDGTRAYVTNISDSSVSVINTNPSAGPPSEDATTGNSITMTRMKASVASDVTIRYTLQNEKSGTLTVTFPSGFTINSVTGAGSSGCLSNFSYIGLVITADKTLCAGPIVLSGINVTNPSSPGQYHISWVNDDPGGGEVFITSEDQISITASVDPSITFNVGAQSSATACDGTFNANGGTVTLGTLLTSAVTTSGHPTPDVPSPLGDATNVVFDTAHNRLFVGTYSRVAVFDTSSGITDDMPAKYILGQPNFLTPTGPNQGSGFADGSCNVGDGNPNPCGMNQATSLAYDAVGNRLFVGDAFNFRVLVFDVATITNGEPAVNVLGQKDFFTATQGAGSGFADSSCNAAGDGPPNPCGMQLPFGLAYDASGSRLFVSDSYENRVTVFDGSSISNGVAAIHVLGTEDLFGSYSFTAPACTGGTPNACSMQFPESVAFNGSRLFVADMINSRVTIYDVTSVTDGEPAVNVLGQPDFVTTTQNNGSTFTGISSGCNVGDGTPSACGMYFPGGVAYDAAGQRLFVSDQNDHRVTVFDLTSVTDGEPAVNVLGQPDFSTNTQNKGSGFTDGSCNVGDGTVNHCGMSNVSEINFDPTNNRLFVPDGNQRVTEFDTTSISDGDPYEHKLSNAGEGATPDGVILVPHICTRVSTNATSGGVVTVKSTNASLKSVTVPADAIPSSSATLTAGTEGYGLCAGSSSLYDSGYDTTNPAGAAPTRTSPFNGSCTTTGHAVGALTTSPQSVWSISGPSSNAYFFLFMKAAISATTKAHSDYTDTLTFVATGTF